MGGDAPLDALPAQDVTRARELARSMANASPSDVETLAEPLALAVMEAAVRARDPRLPEALALSARKPIAKAAKKALYQLRSLGVDVPEREEEALSQEAPAPSQPAEELPSILSAVTGWGEQALVVPRPLRSGGLEITQAILSDERGIIGLGQKQVSRGSYRKQLKQFSSAGRPPVIHIGLEEARGLLSRAAALNLQSRTPYPEDAEEFLRHIRVVPKEEPFSLPPPSPDEERLANESSSLFQEPELQPWIPPDAEVRVLAAKMDEVLHSPLQLTEAQRSEQILHQF